MPTTRIVLDGLWRCICPSFDIAVLSVPLRNTSLRPCINRRRKPSILSRYPPARSNHIQSSPSESRVGEIRRVYSIPTVPDNVSSSSAKGIVHQLNSTIETEKEAQTYENLHEVPKDRLHDVLRQVRTQEGAYSKITDLVRYLCKARGEKPILLHYDALIRANSDAERGSAAAVADLLEDMKEQGIAGDSGLYHAVLQALAIHPDYVLRDKILQEMKERWFTLTLDGWHNLVIGLLRDGQYEMALDRLEQMQVEGIHVHSWLYDIMIYVLCDVQELDEAVKITRHRVDSNSTDISANIWNYILEACCSQLHYPGISYVWQQRVSRSYLVPSDGICTAALNTAARVGDSGLATDVVQVLVQRAVKLDVHHYEAMLTAYVGDGDLDTAMRILSIMKGARLEPSEGTTRPIFTYLVSQGMAKNKSQQNAESPVPLQAWKILEKLHKAGQPIPVAAPNVILSAAVAIPSFPITSAIDLYKQLHKICDDGPNTATFNALLQGCSKRNEDGGTVKTEAMFLASEMAALGIKPDEITYDRSILASLNDANDGQGLENAFEYLDEMRAALGVALQASKSGQNYGAPLRMGTWNILVKKCAEAGDEKVWALLEEMEDLGMGTMRLRSTVEEQWHTKKSEKKRKGSLSGWRDADEKTAWALPSEL